MMKRFVASCISGLFVLLFSAPLLAHIESDSMPDAIAEMEYKIYLEFKPDDTKILNKLGMVYYRKNKLEKALSEFNRVIKISPNDHHALAGLGLVEAKKNNHDQAVSFYKKSIAENKEDAMVFYFLGVSLEFLKKYPEAQTAFKTSFDKAKNQQNNLKKAEIDLINKALKRIGNKMVEMER